MPAGISRIVVTLRRSCQLSAAVLMMGLVPRVVAAHPATPIEAKDLLEKFDINENGKLEKIEVVIALIVKNKIAPIDVDGLKAKYKRLCKPVGKSITYDDLNLTDVERNSAEILYEDFRQKYHKLSGETVAYNPAELEAVDLGATGTPFKARISDNFVIKAPKIKVRRTDDQLKYADPADAQSAILSYARDFNAGINAFNLQGSIAVDVPIMPEALPAKLGQETAPAPAPAAFEIRSIDLRTSATFAKATGQSTPSANTNSLTGRVGSQFVIANHDAPGNILDGEVIVTNFTYTTDFDGNEKVAGGELNLTPYRQDLAIGAFNGFGPAVYPDGNPLVKVLFNVVLHMEGGSVIDDGGDEKLALKPDYFRIGPLIGAKLVPTKLPELALSAQYNYYFDIANSSLDQGLFIASAEWDMGGTGHYNLKVEYQNGRTPIDLKQVNSFTAGLGVKY